MGEFGGSFGDRLTGVLSHEVGHILGYEHADYQSGSGGLLSAVATEYVVNSLSDRVDYNGRITLREALQAADSNQWVGNARPGDEWGVDVINVAPSLSGGRIELTSGLFISDDVTIIGPAGGITLGGTSCFWAVVNIMAMSIDPESPEPPAIVFVELSNLTITDGPEYESAVRVALYV